MVSPGESVESVQMVPSVFELDKVNPNCFDGRIFSDVLRTTGIPPILPRDHLVSAHSRLAFRGSWPVIPSDPFEIWKREKNRYNTPFSRPPWKQ